MDADLAILFRNATGLHGSACLPWLRAAIEEELCQMAEASQHWPDSPCSLDQLHSFLEKALFLLSNIAQRLVEGSHIRSYIQSRIRQTERENDFSDLSALDHLNDKHTALQKLSSDLHKLCHQSGASRGGPRSAPALNSHPSASSSTPQHSGVFSPIPSSTPPYHTTLNVVPALSDDVPADEETCHEPSSSVDPDTDQDEESEFACGDNEIDALLNSLSHRGKGIFYCPYGAYCKKEGIGADGVAVCFRRNSAIRAHLQKHRKPYRCNIPGCKNKNGFARIDQLQRHQSSTHHGG